ncbi:MAG TPA: alkaline phosphatase family protein [Thermoanaerobaculia bacterium]|jgi:predicted AlkP superfamily pyrophosphatase or phosphodiesterase|nr:alkaline phosphatase family protein [Thermoanaerobaculia bacterium]
MRHFVAALAVLALGTACSSAPPAAARSHRPALIVTIAVDQLRADLLDRYDAVFTGGFRRLRDHGRRFTNTYVDHAPTTSFPGHTTIATGCNPAKHGIVAGGWPEYLGDGKFRGIEPARDDAESTPGFPSIPGASPRRILAPALADWVMDADPASRIVAVGGGEFSSLLHAGHTHQVTYWFNSEAGEFVTSTYYTKSVPEWVARFNREELPKYRDVDAWNCSVPEQQRSLALPDAEPFEFDGVHTHFPHRVADEAAAQGVPASQAHAEWYTWTPQQDEATFALAERAIDELHLGSRGHTDSLSIVASSVDSVGHRYGPFSLEQLDTLVRLDRDLDVLFRLLDERLGKDGWTVALTADHGVDDVPEHLRELGVPGRRLTPAELDQAMDAAFAITHTLATPEQALAVKSALERFDFIARVLTPSELVAPPNGDVIADLFRHSYRPDRVPVTVAGSHGSLARLGMVAVLKPHVITDAPANHSSPYDYDRHVPLIFYGAGVKPGIDARGAHTTDVAPTLAALGGIRAPKTIDGRALCHPERSEGPGW